jgi:hypothetical protein
VHFTLSWFSKLKNIKMLFILKRINLKMYKSMKWERAANEK